MSDNQLDQQRQNPIKTAFLLLLTALILLVALPFLLPGYIKGFFLRLKFRQMAHRQGKFVLFVYSDSPNWKPYIEQNILPHIQEHAILLNWSERSKWDQSSWAVQAFLHWGGQREFNPMAIVFCSLVNVRVFRFYKAFRELKRGKPVLLKSVEAELVQVVNVKATEHRLQNAG